MASHDFSRFFAGEFEVPPHRWRSVGGYAKLWILERRSDAGRVQAGWQRSLAKVVEKLWERMELGLSFDLECGQEGFHDGRQRASAVE